MERQLIRIEFIRSKKDGQWMAIRTFDDGSSNGGRFWHEDIMKELNEVFKINGNKLGGPEMPTDLIK
ncbi:hypothetical protein SEA_TOMAS_91 [Streptomyces phage Tomas]|uniref:Uncharacterized protein n=1 Tax=Streptomyces phage Tomas TaxID=2914443 RepID=A0AA49H0Z7_9CAUD|nr:hypothetical protein PP453_gp188 [Streptomyces phage Tomas]UMO76279.1 hypothetical protein SEA_TOMAS_91 [Streptomyces phage Tomas]